MTDLIQNYPKSSCNCYNCDKRNYNVSNPNGIPTNMSVRNCDFSDYYNCDNQIVFKSQIEPSNKQGYNYINPEAVTNSYDKTFQAVPANYTGFNNTVFVSNDPRLISGAHNGQILALDRPPMNAKIELDQIYLDPLMKEYGKKYNDYSDVKAGQIVYYIDKSIEDANYLPVYTNNAYVKGVMYKDPMDGMNPQYIRTPVIKTDLLDTKNNKTNQLSWIRDSLESREDLINLQQQKYNKQKYSSRWTGNLFF
jgi:hypothetical protein